MSARRKATRAAERLIPGRKCEICSGPLAPGALGVTCSRPCRTDLRERRRINRLSSGPRSQHETCHHLLYGLSCEDYESLIARAGGRCERCGTPTDEVYASKLVIDHDHAVGDAAVRGLLCQKCNAHLRRVDAGETGADDLTRAYLANAWHLPTRKGLS